MASAVRNPKGIATSGLACFPFARRYLGNRCFFLFLRLLRCFSSAGVPPHSYGFTIRWLCIAQSGFPIRKSAGRWLFAPLRSLSQLVTSFVGSWCQVILPTLFLTWPVKTFGSRKLYKNKRNSFLKLKFTQNIFNIYLGKTFSTFKMQTFVCGVCDTFVSFSSLSLLSIILFDVSLFSFQSTNGGPRWTRTTDLTLIRRAL